MTRRNVVSSLKVLAIVLLGLFSAKTGLGCTCGSNLPPLKELAVYDAVFSGKVIEISYFRPRESAGQTKFSFFFSRQTPLEQFDPGRTDPFFNAGHWAANSRSLFMQLDATQIEATVIVGKSWKGNVHGTVTITTGRGVGDCGYVFEKGQSYLFYSSGTGDGKWSTGTCSRTKPLANAANEILELEGRLPVPETPPREPRLPLLGKVAELDFSPSVEPLPKINAIDALLQRPRFPVNRPENRRYVFLLRNGLHERIAYLSGADLIEVLENGRWIAYPPNSNDQPRAELSPVSVAKELAKSTAIYRKLDSKDNAAYVDRLSAMPLFVVKPTKKKRWRVGLQYVTERELDAGAKIQDSPRFVWSKPIDESTPTRRLSFAEAFTRHPTR